MVLVGGWLLYRTLDGVTETDGGSDSDTDTLGSRDDSQGDGGPEATDATAVSRSITVGRPADELYETWRDPEEFSRIMGHFAEVTSLDGERFQWTVHGPGNRELSWETRLVEEEPGQFLRWETTEDVLMSNEGSVRFRPAPGDRGTEVTLSVEFEPPGGKLGTAVLERLEIAPETLAAVALRRFKGLAETGEIATLEGNPSARGKGDLA